MPSKPPQILFDLIDRFERNIESYRSPAYNEAQVRQEFINPFFEALGWDVANKEGSAEAYKGVIHEDAIKVGAPDYCFRIGGARKFFLEAKKPAVNIKEDPDPAYQLRRYAWSAKLPLSILTDFEEFAVYDCRARPSPSDKASAGRIHYLTYKEYATRWDEIAAVFSKDAVRTGSFDKYAVSERKRGTTTVDAEFLAEIEKWREDLAKNLAVRNTALDVHELNFAVQRTIDRLIFLRICEDRGIEPYAQLHALLNGEHIYDRLRHLYEQADDRYNSGLFHFRSEKERAETPDELTLKLKIDDKVLKDIIHGLYYPESPYEFSVMPAEILGQVYEQFLGKVIRLTSGHQAKVEEKPEVKKAGGVYYTPAYIVEYIVRNTVGRLCDGKTPKQIEKIKVLDPACGSGSFLLGAYQYLLNYHLEYFRKHPKLVPVGFKQGEAQNLSFDFYHKAGTEDIALPLYIKANILKNNIFGVDIDPQAVEITMMSLYLKLLEGERSLLPRKQQILPSMTNNIKCGNSLIGYDIFENLISPFDSPLIKGDRGLFQTAGEGKFPDELKSRINPFDWNSKNAGFGKIMEKGGFDIVIGNPPYFNINIVDKEIFYYLESKYSEIHTGYNDIMYYFIYKGIDLLNKNGIYGVITSNYYLGNSYARPLRRYFKRHVSKILNFKDYLIFDEANVHTNIIIAHKKPV